jgi:hypothetical protein
MKPSEIKKRIDVMRMVMQDVENDARDFDGKLLTGRNVAEYFGNHGAAIAAVANAVKDILKYLDEQANQKRR